jgi:hypothetical protein
MVAGFAVERPPSLLSITIRRSIVVGRIYLIIGTGYLLVLGLVTGIASPTAFGSLITLFLPVFAVTGAMGGLMVFTNDRLKGVFEYLLAYGVSSRRLFTNVLAATVVLVSIVLGASLTVGLGVYLADGHTISANLAIDLAVYSIPMSYASAALAATVGMFWTSLSSPRTGMNSPVGLMPIIGIAPSLITVGCIQAAASVGVPALTVVTVAVVLVAAAVLFLLRHIGRLMPLERLLSPT